MPDYTPRAIEEWAPRVPSVQVIPLGVNDGCGHCECDNCRVLDIIENGKRNMGNRYAQLYNACADELTKEFTGKMLGIFAYGGIHAPPTEPLRPNMLVVICNNCPGILSRIDAWSKKATHLALYDYFPGVQVLEPRHYPHVVADYLRRLVTDYRICAVQAEVVPFWPFDAPRLYVLLELLWNMNQDVDALLSDYFTNFHQEAAAPMSDFFQRIEDVYPRQSDLLFFWNGVRSGGFEGWTLDDLAYMDGRIAEAKNLAHDQTVLARVRMTDEARQHVRCWLEVYVHTEIVREVPIASRADVEKALNHARSVFAAQQRRADWDRKVLNPAGYPSEEYYKFYVGTHYAKPSPGVKTDTQAEDTMDNVFDRISRFPGADARGFWLDVAKEDRGNTRLTALARSQVSLLDHPSGFPNVIPDGDFEAVQDEQMALPEDLAVPSRFEMRDDKLPHGYLVWSYIGQPADFVWTDRVAHSGKRCIGIENNQDRAAINRRLEVQSGERYRIAVFATRLWRSDQGDVRPGLAVEWAPRDINPGLSVEWKGTPVASLTKRVGIEKRSKWEQVMLRVTVPGGARVMVVSLKVSDGQVGNGGRGDAHSRRNRVSRPRRG